MTAGLDRLPPPILADALEDVGKTLLSAAVRCGDPNAIWSRIVLHGDADLPSPGWLRFGIGCDRDGEPTSWIVSCRLPLWAAKMVTALNPDWYVAIRDRRSGEPCRATVLDAENLGVLLVAAAFGLDYGSPTSWYYGQIRNLPCELASLRPGRRAKAIGAAILTALTESVS